MATDRAETCTIKSSTETLLRTGGFKKSISGYTSNRMQNPTIKYDNIVSYNGKPRHFYCKRHKQTAAPQDNYLICQAKNYKIRRTRNEFVTYEKLM
jgi:hypothetical protein